MMNSNFSIEDFRQRHRVLGRRADTRLAAALRQPVPLTKKVFRQVLRSLPGRRYVIRRWQDGGFVPHRVGRPRAA